MKVLVAGATGAIGRPIIAQLAQRRHTIVALSRSHTTAPNASTRMAVCDVLDPDAVEDTVARERPEGIIAELTTLPKKFSGGAMKKAYPHNNKVRLEGTRNLLKAAENHGVKTFVAQSSGFWYAPTPGTVKTEGDPLWSDAPEPLGEAVRACLQMERLVQATSVPRWVLLRYAGFYGPGTWFAADGTVVNLLRKRRFPILGNGDAVVSFVHVEDAASATVAALERPVTGIFNVADDEPAPANVWMLDAAKALGAKPPRRVPAWVGRLAVGRALAEYTMNTRGADNRRAKKELHWTLRYPSWREGFRHGL
jgi:2-alkyl-3-oxoalkanoate reductase